MIALVVFLSFIFFVALVAGVFSASVFVSLFGGMLTVFGIIFNSAPEFADPARFRSVQCREMVMPPDLGSVGGLILQYLAQTNPRVRIWQIENDGGFSEQYTSKPRTLTAREIENMRESYNVARLDLSKIAGQNERYNFSGPVFVYSSQTENLEAMMQSVQGLRVSSRTAVIFCNENLPSARLIFDAPAVVSSLPLSRQVMLMNVATPGHPTLQISYSDILEKAVEFVQVAIREFRDGRRPTQEKVELILRELRRGMPKSSAPPRPIDFGYQQERRN